MLFWVRKKCITFWVAIQDLIPAKTAGDGHQLPCDPAGISGIDDGWTQPDINKWSGSPVIYTRNRVWKLWKSLSTQRLWFIKTKNNNNKIKMMGKCVQLWLLYKNILEMGKLAGKMENGVNLRHIFRLEHTHSNTKSTVSTPPLSLNWE